MAEANNPRSLSTMETRTLNVPKSTPATTAIYLPRWKALRQFAQRQRESSSLALRREFDAINQPEDEQQGAPPHRSVQLGQYRVGWMRPLGQPAGKNQKTVHQQKYAYKEPHRNDLMFFAHLASPENDLKNQQNRERCNSPEKRPVQKTSMLFVRDLRQRINNALQFFVGPRLGHHRQHHSDQHTSDAGPQRLVHGLCES